MYCEEKLGILLKNLVQFHGALSYDKSGITLQNICELGEKVRFAIE